MAEIFCGTDSGPLMFGVFGGKLLGEERNYGCPTWGDLRLGGLGGAPGGGGVSNSGAGQDSVHTFWVVGDPEGCRTANARPEPKKAQNAKPLAMVGSPLVSNKRSGEGTVAPLKPTKKCWPR